MSASLPRSSRWPLIGFLGAMGCGAPAAPRHEPGLVLTGASGQPALNPSAATAQAVEEQAAPLVVCSWNIKWFGQRPPEEYRFDIMAAAAGRCDVLAIQEVRGKHVDECLSGLRLALSDAWQTGDVGSALSPETGYRDHADPSKRDYVERFAFLYRSTRVELLAPPRFLSEPPINHPVFRQVPWVASLQIVGGASFDFDLLTVHTVYKKELHKVRRSELEAVASWVASADLRQERDALAVGDFNANPQGQPSHFDDVVASYGPSLRVLMQEPVLAGGASIRTTVPMRDAVLGTVYASLPVYDHFWASAAIRDVMGPTPLTWTSGRLGVERFDDEMGWGLTRKELRAAVSDHRLVWATIDFNAPDLDP